ncbi:MAG: hypothetical protein RIE58_02415 [Vicingaceae bacterium]
MNRLILTSVVLLLMPFMVEGQFYDGSNMTFGKNRIQFDEFEWQYYRFNAYETYFYTGGKDLAIYASQAAEQHIREVEDFLNYYNHDKIKYIIYNKYQHYKQSNIGIVDEYSNLGGVNKVIGSKVFIYFEGNHQKFEKEIKAGTVEVLLGGFLYGGDWRSVLRNSDMYRMPNWYFDGLVSYLTEEWNSEVNDAVSDAVSSGSYRRIGRLEGKRAVYAGHSIWKYIGDTYGKSVIPNILYVSRVNKDVESGFLYVLGVGLKDLLKEWEESVNENYASDGQETEMPKEKIMKRRTRKSRIYYGLKADPSGKYITYVMNRKGKAKLYLYDTESQKRKKIFKSGIKLDRPPQLLYPRMAWHPTGSILAYAHQEKGDVFISFYDLETRKTATRRIFLMEDILDINYSGSGKQMTFSGVYDGQSDIYLYNIPGNTQKNITEDQFDDLNPVFTADSKEIVFSSNRPGTEVEHEIKGLDSAALKLDLFSYKIGKETTNYKRITDSPSSNEFQAVAYRNGDILYLSDESGNRNVHKTRYDSVISTIDTTIHYRYFYTKEELSDYSRNVLEIASAGEPGEEVFLYFQDGRYQIFGGDLSIPLSERVPEDKVKTEFGISEPGKEQYEPMDVVYIRDRSSLAEIDIHDYQFDDKKTTSLSYEKEVIVFDRVDETGSIGSGEFVLPQQRNYNLSFFKDQSVLQLNNAFLNQQYQPYGPPYQNPGLGGMLILGISDLFEDHKIYGGVRLGTESSEYMISYQNLKKRLDKEFYGGILNYQTEANQIQYRNRMTKAAVLLKYPFTEVSSLHFSVMGRRDKAVPQARDQRGLTADINEDYWATFKMAYVYDNTRDKGINIKNGTRYKFFGEVYKQLTNEAINMNVVGMDIRHYQKIHREAIFFTRLASGTSFGDGKLVYYLGGIDNWMSTNRFSFDQSIDAEGQNYRFQAIGTNMRGFRQNIRNGNSFAVLNNEIRWPVVKYFFSRPLKSSFLNNFQVIGFGDVGTAWTGPDPLSEDNDQIKDEVEQGPIFVVLKKSNEPIVGGYGFGLRSTVLGYFVRLDWAWGVENGLVKDRIFYFSLSMDL